MCSFYLLLSCATTIFCCIQFSSAGNNETDRLALLEIKAGITGDPLGVMGSWNESLPFCEWHGIVCGHRRSRVIAIYLNSSKLTGTLSPFVGNFSFLRVLSLFNNSLTGTIPPDIGNLHQLRKLWLDTNSFRGEIPSNMSTCSNLVNVDLNNNKLDGAIPVGIGSLTNLNYLSLATNNLRGTIPYCLGNLSHLSLLDIQYNNFVGTIPDSIGKLKKLTFLALNWNKLSGTVPISIFNLSSLTTLALGFNHLEGSLPLDFGYMLPNLDIFGIDSNQFTGLIPASISNSSNLVTFQVDDNYLKGPVPSLHKLHMLKYLFVENNSLGTGQANDLYFVSSLANATALDSVDIGTNNFGGMFPNIICNFSMLSYLALDMNHIIGQIPICIENLASLKLLEFDNNGLSGVIPSGMGKLKRLGYLSLHHNQLSGYIPSSIGNLTQLAQLLLNENYLQGSVPLSFGNCKYLQVLNLSQNNLGGGIPPSLFSLASSLTTLDLSNNPLAGSLPTEVGELKSIDFLDVSHTMLSGEIPSTLGSCSSLEYLYMAGNFLQGTIPPTLITLRSLRVLDLSHNNLSGKIPQYLENFSLQSLNLTNNKLEGEVPTGGIFSNVTGFSVSRNNKLCGGITRLKLPPCKLNKSRRRLHYKMRFMISFILGTLGVILLVVLGSLYAFCRKRRRNEPMFETQYALPSLSYHTLVKATNGFSSTNLIGSGSVGFVYKGALDEDQTTVAIKVFNLEHRGAANSFMAECQVLRNVKHRNLLKVITVCSSVDHQGKDFKALVYEYMANGSLEDWLHQKPTNSADESGDARKDLNLFERLDIAVDIAFALKYLHHHSATSIVHCDLKPSNILFDDEMVAHVGDFGLAKFLSNAITSPSASQSSFVGIRGTIGYAAPEYGIGNEASTGGDVYSFGILLLEMLTGRRPTDDMFKGLNLHGFVKMAFPDHVMDILHEALVKDIVGEERNTGDHAPLLRRGGYSMVILEALTSVLGIALCCSAELPQERLDMKDVADELSSIRNKLLGTHLRRQT